MRKQNIGELALIGLLIGSLLTLAAAQPMNQSEDNLSENITEPENESQGLLEGFSSWIQGLFNVEVNETNNTTNESNNMTEEEFEPEPVQ